MKTLSLLLGLCSLTSGLVAYAPHPSTLMVKYKGQMLQVVRVRGSDPSVIVEGKEKIIRSDPEYSLQDAPDFGDGYVDASSGRQGLGGPITMAALDLPNSRPNAPRTWSDWFWPKLVSRQTLKGGFAAVVTYGNESVSHSMAAITPAVIMVHALPELPAGKAVEVEFAGAGNNTLTSEPIYFIQIFDEKGREVMTNDIKWAWEYYARRDLAHLAMARQKYLERFKGMDHDAVPAIMRKPVFPRGIVPPKEGVSAVLTVTPEGSVAEVSVLGVDDNAANQAIQQSLAGWLFLPKLKAGEPVAVKIETPLQL